MWNNLIMLKNLFFEIAFHNVSCQMIHVLVFKLHFATSVQRKEVDSMQSRMNMEDKKFAAQKIMMKSMLRA